MANAPDRPSSRRSGAARSRRRGEDAPTKSATREWLEAIIFAVVIVLIIRSLFFDLFRIPTPSMEKSLLVGDYLFVSKVHYGPRLPMTLGVPFTDLYLPSPRLPYTRIPGFSSVQRNDNIVFNWPEPEAPTDRKMHYIKRVIGLPGEEIAIQDKVPFIDGAPLEFKDTMQHLWRVTLDSERTRLPGSRLREIGVTTTHALPSENEVAVTATRRASDEIASWSYVNDVQPYISGPHPQYRQRLFPEGSDFTPDNYGPLVLPAAGMTVDLTEENWRAYEPVIRRFEGRATGRNGAAFQIDGEDVSSYTFTQDYFFVLGDNRDNSEDSRFWGFVPMDHVVGKALVVYFSWDGEATMPRFSRLFHRIR